MDAVQGGATTSGKYAELGRAKVFDRPDWPQDSKEQAAELLWAIVEQSYRVEAGKGGEGL